MKSRTFRLLAIFIAAAIFTLGLVLSSRLQTREDIAALLPQDDPVVQDYSLVLQHFGAFDSLLISISLPPESPANTQPLITAADQLYETLDQSGLFTDIHYRFDHQQLFNTAAVVQSCKPALLTDSDLAAVAAQLDDQAVAVQLKDAKRRLLEPTGLIDKKQVQADPLDINRLALAKLQSLSQGSFRGQIIEGCIFSPDRRHLFIMTVPAFPGTDSARSEQLVKMLDNAKRDALASASTPVEIRFTGGHLAAYNNARAIKADIQKTITAATVGLALIGLFFFRRKYNVLLMFLPGLFGVTVAVTIFAIFTPDLSAIVIGCGAALIGLAVDYGIHILYCLEQHSADADASPRLPIASLLIACLTTAAVLFCLLLSSLPGQQQMGLFAAVGLIAAAVFAIVILPIITPRPKSQKHSKAIPLVAFCAIFLKWRAQHHLSLLFVAILVVVFAACGLHNVHFDFSVTTLNYLTDSFLEDEKHFHDVWAARPPTTVVVRGQTLEQALQENDRLYDLIASANPTLAVSSIAPVLPSQQTQRQNITRWRQFWSPSRIDHLQTVFQNAAQPLGFSAGAFDPFFNSLDDQPQPVTLDSYQSTTLNQLLAARIVNRDGQYLVMTTLTVDQLKTLAPLLQQIREQVPGVIIADMTHFADYTSKLIGQQVKKIALIGAIIVIGCLLFFFGRPILALIALLPITLAAVTTLGLLGWLNIPVNLMSSLFLLIVFGMGGDYSIFILAGQLDEFRNLRKTSAATYAAVLLCTMTTIWGFVALIFAEHPALFSLGIAGGIGILASLLAAFIVIPTLCGILLPQNKPHAAPTLRILFGSLWICVYLFAAAGFYSYFLRYVNRLLLPVNPQARARFARKYMQKMCAASFYIIPYRIRQQLYRNFDENTFAKPAVIVANHLSGCDIFIALSLNSNIAMVVKRWVWNAPFLGPFVRDARFIAVHNNDMQQLLARCREALEDGRSVFMFPEGTRSSDGRIKRFHNGAFELAIRTRTPILPILLTNTQALMAHKTYWFYPHCCMIRALPRVLPEGYERPLGARDLARNVRRQLIDHQAADWRTVQKSKAFWNNLRARYNNKGMYVENYITWKLRLDPIYRHISDAVPLQGTIFDAGCGYGLMSHVLAGASLERHVTAVDFDDRKIAVATSTLPANGNIEFHQGDLLTCDFPDADAITLIDVLHYWPLEKQQLLIEKICRSLNPGGTLIFRDAIATGGRDHRLVHRGEQFSTRFNFNTGGDGLFFADRPFYLNAFESHGLNLAGEHPDWGPGSNVVFVLIKDRS